MSHPFIDSSSGPSYSDGSNWAPPHQSMPHDYTAPSSYDIYWSEASSTPMEIDPTAYPDSPNYSPSYSVSYNYPDSPDTYPFDDSASYTPLSPASSSSSSSCSDAPITPYYQPLNGGMPLPPAESYPWHAFHSEKCAGSDFCDGTCSDAMSYEYDGWEDPDTTQTYRSIAIPESSVRSSAHDASTALWAYESAVAINGPQMPQYFDASQGQQGSTSQLSNYVTCGSSDLSALCPSSSTVSPPEYSLPPPHSFVSPAMLSIPPPLKVHQPQPRRTIPLVSLSVLASEPHENTPQPSNTGNSPSLSPLEFTSPHAVTSYSGPPSSADTTFLPSDSCPCSGCTDPYPISNSFS
ncbi:hypothetical protein C8J57DRAFT_9976 [Mycena rebaudengoi]|nr:hypothetical protein C8J57DRAFT_9976 [Mycena rebaudengoi]